MGQGKFILTVAIGDEEGDFGHTKAVEEDAVFGGRLRAGQECTCQEQAGSSSHPVPPLGFSEYTPWHRCAVIFKLVRYFLTGRLPEVRSILLVESGSRGLLEGLITGLRQSWGDQIPIDLVTCYGSLPKGFEPHNTRVYRVGDYRGRAARGRLYRELAGNRYGLVGIICSGEIVMAKWKWVLALRAPAKLFIINETGITFGSTGTT